METRLFVSLAVLLFGAFAQAKADGPDVIMVPNPFVDETNGALKALNRVRPLKCSLDVSTVTGATSESLQALLVAIKQDLATKNIQITKVEWPPSAELLFDAGAKDLATLTNVQLLSADNRRFVLRTKGLGADGVWTPVLTEDTGAGQTCKVTTVKSIGVATGRMDDETRRFETEVVEQASGTTVTSGVYDRFEIFERLPSAQGDRNVQRFCIIDYNCPF